MEVEARRDMRPQGGQESPQLENQGPLPPPALIDENRDLEYLKGIGNQMLEINTRLSKVKKNSVKNAKPKVKKLKLS